MRSLASLPFSLILLTLTLLARPARGGSCYLPSGALDTDGEYQPCSSDASNLLSTICCATKRAIGADACAPNGLCQVGMMGKEEDKEAAWVKPGCTKSDWGEQGCLGVCGNENEHPSLTPCDRAAGNASQKWCCGSTQDCCDDDPVSGSSTAVYLPTEFNPQLFDYSAPRSSCSASSSFSSSTSTSSSSSSSSPSSTPTATSTPTTSSSPTSTPAASQNESSPSSSPTTSKPTLSKAAIIGIAVGLSVLALLLITLFILFRRGRLTFWFPFRFPFRKSRSRGPIPQICMAPDEMPLEKGNVPGAGAGAGVYSYGMWIGGGGSSAATSARGSSISRSASGSGTIRGGGSQIYESPDHVGRWELEGKEVFK